MAPFLTLLHLEWPKLYGVLTILSAIGLRYIFLCKLSKSSGEWCTAVSLWLFSFGNTYRALSNGTMFNPIALKTSTIGLSFIFLSKLSKFSGEWCTAVSLWPFSLPVRKYRELLLSL